MLFKIFTTSHCPTRIDAGIFALFYLPPVVTQSCDPALPPDSSEKTFQTALSFIKNGLHFDGSRRGLSDRRARQLDPALTEKQRYILARQYIETLKDDIVTHGDFAWTILPTFGLTTPELKQDIADAIGKKHTNLAHRIRLAEGLPSPINAMGQKNDTKNRQLLSEF